MYQSTCPGARTNPRAGERRFRPPLEMSLQVAPASRLDGRSGFRDADEFQPFGEFATYIVHRRRLIAKIFIRTRLRYSAHQSLRRAREPIHEYAVETGSNAGISLYNRQR